MNAEDMEVVRLMAPIMAANWLPRAGDAGPAAPRCKTNDFMYMLRKMDDERRQLDEYCAMLAEGRNSPDEADAIWNHYTADKFLFMRQLANANGVLAPDRGRLPRDAQGSGLWGGAFQTYGVPAVIANNARVEIVWITRFLHDPSRQCQSRHPRLGPVTMFDLSLYPNLRVLRLDNLALFRSFSPDLFFARLEVLTLRRCSMTRQHVLEVARMPRLRELELLQCKPKNDQGWEPPNHILLWFPSLEHLHVASDYRIWHALVHASRRSAGRGFLRLTSLVLNEQALAKSDTEQLPARKVQTYGNLPWLHTPALVSLELVNFRKIDRPTVRWLETQMQLEELKIKLTNNCTHRQNKWPPNALHVGSLPNLTKFVVSGSDTRVTPAAEIFATWVATCPGLGPLLAAPQA